MTFKRVSVLGLPVDAGGTVADLCGLLGADKPGQTIAFIEPGAWHLATTEPTYAQTLSKLSLLPTDGLGVALATRLLTGETCHPIGLGSAESVSPFFETAARGNLTIGLIGGRPGVDEDFHGKLLTIHRDLKVVVSMHGYGDVPSKIARLVAASPSIILVGIESPRQEEFLLMLRDAGYKGTAIACGDFFDRYLAAGYHAPCPDWMKQYYLGFLYRIYSEPGRLWRRYLADYPFFYALILRSLIQKLVARLRSAAAAR